MITKQPSWSQDVHSCPLGLIYKLYFVKVINFLPTPFTSFSTIIDIPYNKNSLWSGHLEFWFDWYQRYQRFYVSYKLSTELHGEIQNKQWSLRLLRIHYLTVTSHHNTKVSEIWTRVILSITLILPELLLYFVHFLFHPHEKSLSCGWWWPPGL